MSAIKESIDISRRPEDVFSYAIDPAHLAEWQESVVNVKRLDTGPIHEGSRMIVTRRVGRREFPVTVEVTELDPPHSWHTRGIDGPIRGDTRCTIEPLGDGERSRVSMDLDFEAHGMGKVILPLVVRPHARKEMPKNEQKLKALLESGDA